MPKPVISYGTRKALEVQLGDEAARELIGVLQKMSDAVASLEKRKVDITPVAPLGGRDVLSIFDAAAPRGE
jgi:hypothetical protein